MNFHPSPKNEEAKVTVPVPDEIETKSPATKLLKRRREMYQKQEEYEN